MTPPDHISVALVVAMAENRVIGRDGKLPWRIPSEMQHFRRITMGKPVIMGRRTFSSLKKPLHGRDNIVLTQNRDFAPKGAIAVEGVEQALRIAGDCASARSAEEIAIIGGAEIYALFLPHAERIYLTRVHAQPDGDTLFPEIDPGDWVERERTFCMREPEDDHDYTIVMLDRRENKP